MTKEEAIKQKEFNDREYAKEMRRAAEYRANADLTERMARVVYNERRKKLRMQCPHEWEPEVTFMEGLHSRSMCLICEELKPE